MNMDILNTRLHALPDGEADVGSPPRADGDASGGTSFDHVMARASQSDATHGSQRPQEARSGRTHPEGRPPGDAASGAREEGSDPQRRASASGRTADGAGAPSEGKRQERDHELPQDGNALPVSVLIADSQPETDARARKGIEVRLPASASEKGRASLPGSVSTENREAIRPSRIETEVRTHFAAEGESSPDENGQDGLRLRSEPGGRPVVVPSLSGGKGVSEEAAARPVALEADRQVLSVAGEKTFAQGRERLHALASFPGGEGAAQVRSGAQAPVIEGKKGATPSAVAPTASLRTEAPAVTLGEDASALSDTNAMERETLMAMIDGDRGAGEAGGTGEMRSGLLQGLGAVRERGGSVSAFRMDAPPAREGEIRAPLGQAAWERSLAQQVLESVETGERRLTLRLHPASLGTVEVRLSADESGARVQLHSPQAAVREAMEAALPRLRELFQGSGLNLVEATVSRNAAFGGGQSGAGQGQPFGAGSDPGAGGSPHDDTVPLEPEATSLEEPIHPMSAAGRIDYYA